MGNLNIDSLFDKDAEMTLLGCMMVDNGVIIPQILPIVEPESFYTVDHQLIFKSIISAYDEIKDSDPILVANRLNMNDELNRVGGSDYLYELHGSIVETESAVFYAEIIRDLYLRRRMIQNATKIREMCLDGNLSVQEIIDQSQNITSSFVVPERSSVNVSDILLPVIKQIEEHGKRDGNLIGISTKFPLLDDITLGLQGGSFYVIAARPSHGKTTYSMNIAQNIAIDAEYPVLIFSLEMPKEDLTVRLMSGISHINLNRIRTGKLSKEQYSDLDKAVKLLDKSNLILNDNTTLSIDSILAETRRIYNENKGLSLVVVDYLQLIKAHRISSHSNREQEVAYMSRELKRLSIELNIPIIACAQLNRDIEKRAFKEPQLSDLRESGAIEQDADFVAFIHHEEEDPVVNEKGVILLIKKHRNGRCGEINYNFRTDVLLFEEKS